MKPTSVCMRSQLNTATGNELELPGSQFPVEPISYVGLAQYLSGRNWPQDTSMFNDTQAFVCFELPREELVSRASVLTLENRWVATAGNYVWFNN